MPARYPRTTIRLGAAHAEMHFERDDTFGAFQNLGHLLKHRYDHKARMAIPYVDQREASILAKTICRRHGITERNARRPDNMRSFLMPEAM